MTHFTTRSLRPLVGIALLSGLFALAGCTKDPASPKKEPPVIATQPQDASVLVGTSASFSVSATGATSYQWIRGANDTLAGETDSVLMLDAVTLSMDGDVFKCLVGNADSTIVSDSATLTVQDSVAFGLFLPRTVLRDTGAALFSTCAGCHGESGEGGRGPKIANADFFMNPDNRELITKVVLAGGFGVLEDTIRVNGVLVTTGGMPGWASDFDDAEIAGLLTYVRSVLTDTLVTNCAPSEDSMESPCTRTERTENEMDLDSVAVWEVRAVRDTLDI